MDQKIIDRGRYIPWIFLPTVIALVIQTAVSIMSLEVYIIDGMLRFKSGTYTDFMVQVINNYTSNDAIAVTSIVYAIITAIFALVVYRNMFRDGKLQSLSGKSNNIVLTCGGILLFVVSMQYVTVYLVNAFSSAFPAWLEEYNELMDSAGLDSDMTVLMVLYAVVFAPICEELLFRGITFFAAKKVMPVYFAILVQAIMFGTMHMNKLQSLYTFVFGLCLGYIMYLYDNILITIFIHMLYNVLGTVLAEYLPMAGNTVISFFLCSLVSLVAAYASIILLRKGASSVKDEGISADI